MSEWTVHLEFEEGTSSKFWRARVEGKTLYVNYGKIGSAGQTQVKDFANADAAQKEYDKLVREKRKKGYVDSGGGGGGNEDDDAEHEPDGDDEDGGEEEAPRKPVPSSPHKAATTRRPDARLTLDAGGRTVETLLYLDGNTVRMDSSDTYASPEAAKKVYERLKRVLLGEGYTE